MSGTVSEVLIYAPDLGARDRLFLIQWHQQKAKLRTSQAGLEDSSFLRCDCGAERKTELRYLCCAFDTLSKASGHWCSRGFPC